MTEKLEIYKCMICNNVVEIAHNGIGELVCCNENMLLMTEYVPNIENAHYAHIENIDNLTKRVVFNHPMTSEHYIEYVEAISKDKKYLKRKFFNSDEKCEFTFRCECKEGFYIRLYCNKDGVWVTNK